MSLERALRVSREIRSVDSSQGPGATFPEMSQVPVLSEGSRTKARCGESRGVTSRRCWSYRRWQRRG